MTPEFGKELLSAAAIVVLIIAVIFFIAGGILGVLGVFIFKLFS